MKESTVRITRVEINNFKNVEHGILDLHNNRREYESNVLGLYGQNGSGKTALIDSLYLLKLLLSGKSIPSYFANFINVDAEYSTIKFNFDVSITDINCDYYAEYCFSIRKEIDETEKNTDINANINENLADAAPKFKVVVFNEILSSSYKYKNDTKHAKFLPLINTNSNEVFLPRTKYEILVGTGKSTNTTLLSAKKYSAMTSRSFVFSKELLDTIRKNCTAPHYLKLIEKMIWYGNYELFVINTTTVGLITLNTLLLDFRFKENGKTAIGRVGINLDKPTLIPHTTYAIVKKVISNMNVVLTQLVPGLEISLKDLGNELSSNGNVGTKIQLVSIRNGKEIPLNCESEGIKKIISVLQLLIVVYNQRSITVAIDELDSGIFEYLLGELLRIVSEKGKGQLIFTSHNLRPLETIDKGFIAFTTTNPKQRYIRLSNIKSNNNLRDFYYRDIVLGEQNEPIYETTNNYEIALAFREAGEIHGS